jgi:hypothetical protein
LTCHSYRSLLKLQKDGVGLQHVTPNKEQGKKRPEAAATDTNISASAPQPQGTITASTTETKRSRGDRKANQYPKAGVCYVITEVGPQGQILEPKKYIAKFRNAIEAHVRDKLNLAIPNWKDYPEE